MFCYNASSKLFPSRSTLGTAMKVLFLPSSLLSRRRDDGSRNFPQSFSIYRNDLNFSFFPLSSLFHPPPHHPIPRRRLIQFNINSFRHSRSICHGIVYDQFRHEAVPWREGMWRPMFRIIILMTSSSSLLQYLVTESMINSFTWQMNLTVKNLHKPDFAPYICSSENALGKSDARIRLQGEAKPEN